MKGGRLLIKFCVNPINQLVEILQKGQMPYENTIIIGDNSSGKSLLLRQFIKNMEDKKETYFIDAVNRVFDVTKITKAIEMPEYKETIIETRIQDQYFNIQDSFNCYGTLTERVEQIYSAFEEKVQVLFQQLVNDGFKVLYGNPFGEVAFKEGIGQLSSGYQAMVRLLLELTYYSEMGVKKNKLFNNWVVIDELDEFLSPRYASKIFGYLRENFSGMRFIITTHSIDLVVAAQNANVIILDENGYEVIDANDYNSVSEVQRIFQRVFGGYNPINVEVESILRRLMNNKINQAWSKEDEKILLELREEALSASQKLIYRQITEW